MATKEPPSSSDILHRTPSVRPRSISGSYVHFADLPPRSSIASLRSLSNRQANLPTNLHISTLPTFTDGPTASRTESPSPIDELPKFQPNGAVSPKSDSTTFQPLLNGLPNTADPSKVMEKSPSFPPDRRSSQDRRARSEVASRRRPTLLTNGRRLTIGGYETSSDDTDSSPLEQAFLRTTNGHRHVHGLGIRAQSEQGRRRAQTLLPPALEEEPSDMGGVSEVGVDAKRKPTRRVDGAASQRSSRDPLRSPTSHPRSRISSQRSARSGQPMPTSYSDSYFATASAGPSRVSSARSQVGLSRSASSRIKEEDVRGDGVSSPDGSRKGKEKERKIRGLAASLGLDGVGKDVALSPEQINNLINDSDIASALRMMNGNSLNTPRVPFYPTNPSNSSFSPPSSRPGSPAAPFSHAEPFLVSAPPALTEPTVRDRNISISSTVVPSPRSTWDGRSRNSGESSMLNGDASTPRRRRASSQLTTSPYIEGGHVPFTHHVPVVTVDEDEGSETASIPVIQDQPVTVENGGLQREVSIKLDLGKKEEKKGRISQLFHRKSKKGEVRPAQPPSEHHHSDHKAHEEAKEREKQESVRQKERLDREGEMKRKEAERREAEVVQERRFRALTQVAGHPESERMAYRTASHLRAYYNHIYDGLDNPPRMNPLAVLRWRIRTNEQIEAKSKWEALQTETKVAPDFGDIMHASPVSIGTPHFGRPAKSEANRPSSLGSNRMPSPRRNKSEFDFASTAKRWRYTMEDVAAYKECDGVVNYFIPPRPPSATEVVGCERMESRPENSSIADSMKKVDTQAQANVTAASQNGNDRSTESPDASLAPLSRSVSFETGGQSDRFRDHRLLHRAPHGSANPLTQALKIPFEKLGSAARKQTNAFQHKFPPHDEVDDSQNEAAKHEPHHHVSLHHLGHRTTQHARRASTAPHPSFQPLAHQHPRLFRREAVGSVTDEERGDRESHLRKLFLKGQRPQLEYARPRRSDASDVAKAEQRHIELRHLESALARESAFRQRQAEVDRRTQLEAETRERIALIEGEIYQERLQRTTVARKRLDAVNTNLDLVNDNMRHFLAQIDQVRTVAKVSAEVDMVWPNIEMLQKSYFRRSSVDDYGDGQDRTTSPNGNDRSIMMNVRTNPPKRKGTLSNPLPSLFNYGIKPWPRRSSLDPSGSTRVDPIRRLELTVGNVRGQRETLIRRRGETTRELQSMIGRIDALIRQKDAVRTWTKAALEQNRSLQHTVDTLLRQIRGDSRARMGRVKDRIYDTLVRRLLSPLFRGVFGVFYMGRWVWSLRSPHSRGERYRGLRNAPWGVWGFGAVMVGLVAFFYYIGG